MAEKTFTKNFTRQEPICEEGIEKALEILRTGKLHRYNVDSGEKGEAALLEEEFAAYMGKKYCLACASCGSAIYLALKALGVGPGDKVLCNAFTLAPVPGAIENSGADVELVEITDDYTVDLDDLIRKAAKAKWFLLSHMRGHIVNMDRVMEICRAHDLTLIEDAAHTMGASWDGMKSGAFGKVGCFSTQTYKHINSGEGGLLVTDDPEVISRATIHSGSYMLYDRHTSRPSTEVFEPLKTVVPSYSCRMDNLRAAILRPQLQMLDEQCARWNKRYRILEQGLNRIDGIACPKRDPREAYVGSSIQFSLIGRDEATIQAFLQSCMDLGVELKWFGNKDPVGFTSAYSSWKYIDELPSLPATDRILSTMCDMRVPLTFSEEDCQAIVEIIGSVALEILFD
ncbi:MAG: aminotransferase class I/II-fold pyridoxal phosphate-dependent enzyme [Desulfofustis sp.]|nr:aminotransferase class I/II-fold pyridoxal phosphate-dependent enzyme [Desulfofustis sp.]